MFKERIIKTLSGKEFSYEEFEKSLRVHEEAGFDAYIGTDSQVSQDVIHIATCVALVRRGHSDLTDCSGDVFYVKDKIPRKDYHRLRNRMLLEAYRSIEVAMEIDLMFNNDINIHLDIGQDPRKSKSSAYKTELTKLVEGQGYNVSLKPEAWCASGVADRMCR